MFNAFIRSFLFWIAFVALLYGVSKLSYLTPPDWQRPVNAILGILCAFFLIWLFLKNEKPAFKDIGLVWERSTVPRFLIGVGVGTVLIALVLIVFLCFSEIQLRKNPDAIYATTWLKYLAVIIPFAFMEELVFRSYAYLKLNKAYGLWLAQIITAIAFALYHVASGWSLYISFLGPFVWAFVFGLASVRSRGIAMPTGIHTALNALQVFTGIKRDNASFWILDFKQDYSENAQSTTDSVGLLIHLTILAGALGMTAVFIRKTKQRMAVEDQKTK